MTVLVVLATALLSAALSGAVVWLLWHRVLAPDAERRVRELSAELTRHAQEELTATGEALVPQFRQAVRDGIQDAFLTPPTDRLGQTARGVTNAGVNVVESGLRRIFGVPTTPARPDAGPGEADR